MSSDVAGDPDKTLEHATSPVAGKKTEDKANDGGRLQFFLGTILCNLSLFRLPQTLVSKMKSGFLLGIAIKCRTAIRR